MNPGDQSNVNDGEIVSRVCSILGARLTPCIATSRKASLRSGHLAMVKEASKVAKVIETAAQVAK